MNKNTQKTSVTNAQKAKLQKEKNALAKARSLIAKADQVQASKPTIMESLISSVAEDHGIDGSRFAEKVQEAVSINKDTATAANKTIQSNMQFVGVDHRLQGSDFALKITRGIDDDHNLYFACQLVAVNGKSWARKLNAKQLRAFDSNLPIVNEIASKLDSLTSCVSTIKKYELRSK